ncbi:MAG: ATP-binding cassette domain-containing protein [Bacteroidota bacterium]
MPVLSFENVHISQEGIPTLTDISLTVESGEFYYLIGKSGSGKSTFFKAIFGELAIDSGTAQVAGFDLLTIKNQDVPYLRRKLGFVFQDFQLLTDRNVERNLAFVLEATGHKNQAEIKSRIETVLEQVGMSNAIHKRVHKLSGGEQQRIAIARSLLNNPVLILADEPTGHLDPEVSMEIMELFKQLTMQGTSIIMASHDYHTIQRVPGKILKCEGGHITPVGSL